MASGQGVVVEGLKETRQRIKKLSPEADKQFKVALRELATDIAGKAQAEARRKGLDRTGDLIKGIKRGSVTMDKAEIKSTAFRAYEAPSKRGPYQRQRNRSGQLRQSYVGKDFAYPKVYEFGDRGRGLYGSRAFLNPTLMKSRDHIAQRLLQAIDDASRTAGFK